MPLQNRVSPFGAFEESSARGTLMGNRGGSLLASTGRLTRRRWVSDRWIACVLAFAGRPARKVWSPSRYTELFFLDEATAFAAGHRPCAECRRSDFNRFKSAWRGAKELASTEPLSADAIDATLHVERLEGLAQRRFSAPLYAVPDGAMVCRSHDGAAAPLLLWRGGLHPWTHHGYGPRQSARPDIRVEVLTPPSLCDVLRAGYEPAIHDSCCAT